MNIKPPISANWHGRKDTLPNERLFQFVHFAQADGLMHSSNQSSQSKRKPFGIVGFAVDEGVIRNGGRPTEPSIP